MTSSPDTVDAAVPVERLPGKAALAGGCEIVLACDLIVAAENARFGLPEVMRGLIAGAGGVFRLPRAIPPNVALELILTAEPIDARRAWQYGLVNRLARAGGAVDEALGLAAQITRNAPIAVRESLRVAKRASTPGEAELRALSEECRARAAVARPLKMRRFSRRSSSPATCPRWPSRSRRPCFASPRPAPKWRSCRAAH